MKIEATYQNLIGGKEISFSGEFFDVNSPFYEDYQTRVANSNPFDIKIAISKAKNAVKELQELDFDDRFDILSTTSKKLLFSDADKEYDVKMMGMPIKYVESHLTQIPEILKIIPHLIERRIGIIEGRIGRHPVEGHDLFKFLEPIDGFVYCVTPANDPRVVIYVAAWLVTLGIPGIFKVGKTNVRIAQKVIREMIEAGLPSNALNLLCWDTQDENKKSLNFKLVDSSSAVWAFGDDATVDSMLRYETMEEDGIKQRIDHFSSKIVLRHGSGRAAGIVDEDIDIEKAVSTIVNSAMDWPIGCNAMKALFDASNKDEFIDCLIERIDNLKVGDPMDKNTEIGYVNSKTISSIAKRVEQLKKFGLLDIMAGGMQMSQFQMTPIIAMTRDLNSDFLSVEYPIYILTVKKSDSFDHAIEEVNKTAKSKRLVVSIFSEDHHKILRSRIRAYHIKRWRPTTELDILFHEGQDYLHKLTEPQIHRGH